MLPAFWYFLGVPFWVSANAETTPSSFTTDTTWLAVLDFSATTELETIAEQFREATTTSSLQSVDNTSISLMTRENLMVLLDANGGSVECLSGQCEVEMGRNIGADWIISGSLYQANDVLFLYYKLHDTHSGELQNAIEISGQTLDALNAQVPSAVQDLLRLLPTKSTFDVNSIYIQAQTSVLGCSPKRLQESITQWTSLVHPEDVACLPMTTPMTTIEMTYNIQVLQHPLTQREVRILQETEIQQASNQPYSSTSWLEATQIANRLSRMDGLVSCYEIHGEQVEWPMGLSCTGWRLPTEMEWELFMRGGNFNIAWSGQHKDAWDNPNSKQLPVCSTLGNDFGVCDIVDNVWEWTWDWSKPYSATTKIDDTGPSTGTQKVMRNGRHRASQSVNAQPTKPVAIRLVRTVQGK